MSARDKEGVGTQQAQADGQGPIHTTDMQESRGQGLTESELLAWDVAQYGAGIGNTLRAVTAAATLWDRLEEHARRINEDRLSRPLVVCNPERPTEFNWVCLECGARFRDGVGSHTPLQCECGAMMEGDGMMSDEVARAVQEVVRRLHSRGEQRAAGVDTASAVLGRMLVEAPEDDMDNPDYVRGWMNAKADSLDPRSKTPCPGCEEGMTPVLLDENGTPCSVSGRPGCWGHRLGDAWWWFCGDYAGTVGVNSSGERPTHHSRTATEADKAEMEAVPVRSRTRLILQINEAHDVLDAMGVGARMGDLPKRIAVLRDSLHHPKEIPANPGTGESES